MTSTPSPVPWKRVAVFVSSTFSDMHAERDYLVKRVFPDLHDWCERRRLRLVDVDLRWGVTEEDATQNRNVVQTCLNRIDECRPFFLCFVGQRRGWVPMTDEIHPRTLEAFPELRQHIGKASVTELEILHAIFRPLHGDAPRDPARDPDCYRPADYSFFYLRDPSYLESLPADSPELAAAYTNAGVSQDRDDEELRRWREEEIPKCGRPVRSYSAEWKSCLSTPELALPLHCPASAEQGRERWRKGWTRAGVGLGPDGLHVVDENRAHDFNRRLTTGRLSEFRHEGLDLADVILDDLKRGIAARYPDHVEVEGKPGSLQTELDQQEQFLFVNSEGFIERGHDFDELDEYVRTDLRKLFVLTAEGGMGKSMLLANWINRCRSEGSPLANAPILFRFVGQSDGSTTASNLQASILNELRDVHGRLPETVRVKQERQGPPGAASESVEREVPLEIPGDPNKLLEFWREWLPKAAAQGKCVIVIDALNQLAEGLEHLHWLPQGELPEGLKFIVSFRRGAPGSERLLETWRGPYYADKVHLAEVRPFAAKEHRRALVGAYLDRYLKALEDHLIEELISAEGAANPLFLKIVLSELRVFGSFEQLGQKIRTDFGTDPVSAFRAVMRRLISDPAYAPIPSAPSVPVVFGTLVCARGGLSVEELSDILCRALGQTTPTDDDLRNARESVLVILRQERPFLARRDGRYDFFYESFQTAAREAFCLEPADGPAPDADGVSPQTDGLADHPPRRPPRPRDSICEDEGRGRTTDLTRSHTSYPEKASGETCQPPLPAPSAFAGPTADKSARPTRDWQGLIADHYAGKPNTNRRRLSELPHHLTSAERWDDLIGDDETAGPLSDLLFIQAKCEAGLVYELVTDYNAALAALPEFREENERNRRHGAAMIAYNKALREYAIVRCDWWFAKERGDTRPEPPYPPMPEELRDEVQRQIPEESSPRAAQLRHFASFVSGNVALLAQHASEMLTLAYNRTSAGSVAIQAGRRIGHLTSPWLKRIPRPASPLRPPCLRTLEGHSDSILSVSVSSIGHCAATGSVDGAVRVWDLETGACLRTLDSFCGKANCLEVCADGRRVIAISADDALGVWDLRTGTRIRTVRGHFGTILSVSPHDCMVTNGADATVDVWDLETSTCLRRTEGLGRSLLCVSPDGRRAVTHGDANDLLVIDLGTGACLAALKGHTGYVLSACVSPDGRRVVTGGMDRTARAWDLESGACLRAFEGHDNWVCVVSVSPDGRRAVTGSDTTVHMWDLESGCCLRAFNGHSHGIAAVNVSLDGRYAVSGSLDRTARVWDLDSRAAAGTPTGHDNTISTVSINGRRVFTGSYDGTVRIWDLNSGALLRTLGERGPEVHTTSVSPDGRRAVAGMGGAVLVWDPDSGSRLHTLVCPFDGACRVSVSPDGRRVFAGGRGNVLERWDLESGALLARVQLGSDCTSKILSVSVSPDGRHAVVGSSDKTIRVWDLRGKCLRTLDGNRAYASSVEVCPNGRHAVSGSHDKTVRVWDLASGTCLNKLGGHLGDVNSVCVSSDGCRAVSGSSDGTIRVWDLQGGFCLAVYVVGVPIWCVALSPDSARIVCGTEGGQMHFLTAMNFPPSRPPIVTPVRSWLFGSNRMSLRLPLVGIFRKKTASSIAPGRWDDHLSCRCVHCGKLFVPPQPVLEIGMEGADVIRKGLWLPDSAYAEPRLLAPCPHCGGALKFNPFVVDGRDLG